MIKPGDEDSAKKKSRASLLQDLFNHTNGSTSTTTSKPSNRHSMHHWPTEHHRHHDHIEEEGDVDGHVEQLEDLRMCCNGKHHLSHLERDRIHPNRPKYPKRAYRHSVAVGY